LQPDEECLVSESTTLTLFSQSAQYQDLFNRLQDWVFLVDSETYQVLEVNFACEQSFGLPVQDFLHKPIIQWINPPEHPEFQKALRMAKRKYYPRTTEQLFIGPAGKLIHVEVNMCPLRIHSEQELLQIIVRDITFRREAEQKIKELVNQLQTTNALLHEMSIHDELTGLFNFRHFKKMLESEHQRALRFKTPYSLIFFDLDYFKKYNDQNGHPAGDRVLKHFASILIESSRINDFPCRYGGEEFIMICPATPKAGAITLAERVRVDTQQMNFEFSKFQPTGALTVSAGVATYPDDALTTDMLLKAADQSAYSSKEKGRNQVSSAPPLTTSPSAEPQKN